MGLINILKNLIDCIILSLKYEKVNVESAKYKSENSIYKNLILAFTLLSNIIC